MSQSQMLPACLSEVDLEIALKQRLADTVESRIAWALTLKDTLQKGVTDRKPLQDCDPLAILSITESPSGCILAQEPRGPPSSNFRPPRRSNLPATKTKFLYIRSSALGTQDTLYRLQCPACLRTSFSSLQGLLNHARLAHDLEWGTHDECIRVCAVPGNESDLQGGLEVGLGPTGVLPGLRTIFQMAVGARDFQEEARGGSISNSQTQILSLPPLLTQTLGLHKDSATLAQYLGKQAIHREIRVWGETDDLVDVEALIRPDIQDQNHNSHWKMPFTQRNSATMDSDFNMELFGNGSQTSDIISQSEMSANHLEPQPISNLSPTPETLSNDSQKLPSKQSRFYFGTRVIITDRSLWIPPEHRTEQNKSHTHKWMISVDSPSYTYHITSTLNSLVVTPLIPGMSTLPITSEPPFIVVGTSDRPFLARIELSFTSSDNSMDQKVILEHWVELDPLGTHTVVQGEDQIVDIELDKGTILKPIQSGYTPINAKSLWDRTSDLCTPERPVKVKSQRRPLSTSSGNYETILIDILPTFPMTQKDVKKRRLSTSTLPYKLVSSPAHFKTLVTGRRKAIEWGRARAIQEAYCRIIEQMTPREDVISLKVGDVYSWLSENGHFPVALEDQNEQLDTKHDVDHPLQLNDRTLDRWCRICGLNVAAHLRDSDCKGETPVQDMDIKKPVMEMAIDLPWPKSTNRCHIVSPELQATSFPVIDIRRVISGQSEQMAVHSLTELYKAKALVAIGDPLFTGSISRMVKALGLKHFALLDMTYDQMAGHGKTDMEKKLVPFALLAVIAKLFIRLLVKRGLEAVTRDEKNAASFSSKYEKNRSGRIASMLTPTHILSGMVSCGRELDNVLWCLGRVGLGGSDDETRIKMEVERKL